MDKQYFQIISIEIYLNVCTIYFIKHMYIHMYVK